METRRQRPIAPVLLGALLALAACSSAGDGGSGSGAGAATTNPAVTTTTAGGQGPASTMTVTSTAFAEGAAIPDRFTCEGDGVSPPLRWSAPPAGTAELALVVDDPDAPGGTFVHWVIAGIPASRDGLEEKSVPGGAVEAGNSGGRAGYTGPCPPGGAAHHYRFTVYALSRSPGIQAGGEPEPAIAAIRRVATAQGQLVGTFQS